MRTLKLNKVDKLASLSVRQVRWARGQHESGKKTIKQLAKHFDVCAATIGHMLNGRTYANVK